MSGLGMRIEFIVDAEVTPAADRASDQSATSGDHNEEEA